MAETLASIIIEELDDDHHEAGFYFMVEDSDSKSEWIGPYETQEDAEKEAMASLQQATEDMVKEMLGL